jgi:opacity protein-like surface antigen
MKKIAIIVLVTFATVSLANAQKEENALGVRLTGGAEVSYQRYVSDGNRLEFDLGWGWNTAALSGFYQWVNPITEGLKWYIGPGVSLGSYSNNGNSGVNLGVGGTIGLEYNFDFPLQLSLDWRPLIYFGTYDNQFGASNVGLGIRYRF